MPDVHAGLATLERGPQPIVTLERKLEIGQSLPVHQHQRAQLVYASEGTMQVSTADFCYLVPPMRAVWMPAQVKHAIEAKSQLCMSNLYIRPELLKTDEVRVQVLAITPLMKHLIDAMMAVSQDYTAQGAEARLAAVVLDQINDQRSIDLALPIPDDRRLQKVISTLIDDPSNTLSLADWAEVVGASERTLSRLFVAESGMTFGQWRQQRKLHRALELLDAGRDIGEISSALGYQSQSAFSAMFHRVMGESPLEFRRANERSSNDS
ncbi:HTH-type transcriptional regulator NimR [BD1-7 clade bacterium]|uniref:HTH-type transcriptional regulator NimR n=1 Tax=BD1-7 clade bacterium TaxID=2029982 RepID=A0A5S9PJH2_9GAMM|nr:HTH-type transcriptional regulator NimR [BD1-7 clade bacterium]CAA0104329.1 HTH-type transcriptional regulator NimR [BD1-7 clade bacterium]